ncbi:Nucleoplasmin-like domain-containing protein [Entamoeba marina]
MQVYAVSINANSLCDIKVEYGSILYLRNIALTPSKMGNNDVKVTLQANGKTAQVFCLSEVNGIYQTKCYFEFGAGDVISFKVLGKGSVDIIGTTVNLLPNDESEEMEEEEL